MTVFMCARTAPAFRCSSCSAADQCLLLPDECHSDVMSSAEEVSRQPGTACRPASGWQWSEKWRPCS
jgi:hypothetical protein